MKAIIKCNACGAKFELMGNELSKRQVENPSFTCQNCGKQLSKELFGHIQAGLISLDAAFTMICVTNDQGEPSGEIDLKIAED